MAKHCQVGRFWNTQRTLTKIPLKVWQRKQTKGHDQVQIGRQGWPVFVNQGPFGQGQGDGEAGAERGSTKEAQCRPISANSATFSGTDTNIYDTIRAIFGQSHASGKKHFSLPGCSQSEAIQPGRVPYLIRQLWSTADI